MSNCVYQKSIKSNINLCMFCCNTGIKLKNENPSGPKQQNAQSNGGSYVANVVKPPSFINSGAKARMNVLPQPNKIQEQNNSMINFQRELERDVKDNKDQLAKMIASINDVCDWNEYHKIEPCNLEVSFNSIERLLGDSKDQKSQIGKLVEEMQQPYHLLVSAKKQLKNLSVGVLDFLQKILAVGNQRPLEDEVFEKNKEELNRVDPKICAGLQEVFKKVKELVQPGLKKQQQMVLISDRLQTPPSSAPVDRNSYKAEQQLRETLEELQSAKDEVSRFRELLNSQKEPTITAIPEVSKVKDKRIEEQQHQIVRLKQLMSRLEQQMQEILKVNEQLYNQSLKLAREKEGQQQELNKGKDDRQDIIKELQKSKANASQIKAELQKSQADVSKIKAEFVSYQRQMQKRILQAVEQNRALKYKLKPLELELSEQKQLVMSLSADLQFQKTKNGKMYTSTFLEQRTFFLGDILQSRKQQKKYLITTIQQHMDMFIDKTKLLYEYQKDRLKNFHESIDNHRNLVVIVQTQKALFAGYYSGVLQDKTAMTEEGLIISMNNFKFYTLNNLKNNPRKDPNDTRLIRGMVYDKYFLIIGNAEIRIRSGEDKVFSNFGIATSFYNNNRERVEALLGEGTVNEVKFNNYEIHQVTFDENCLYQRVMRQE